jgi:hypothetical protein
MLDTAIAGSTHLRLTIYNRILQGFLACELAALASTWTTKQELIGISNAARFVELVDGLSVRFIFRIGGRFWR